MASRKSAVVTHRAGAGAGADNDDDSGDGEDGGCDSEFTSWFRFYTDRERDLVELLKATCAMWGVDTADRGGGGRLHLFDTHEPASHTRTFCDSQMPCFLTTHRVVCLESERHLLGLEHLFFLGMPHDINTNGVSDRLLRHVAGNSISLDALIPLFGVVFSVVDFTSSNPSHQSDELSMPYTIAPSWNSPQQCSMRFALPGLNRGAAGRDIITKLASSELPAVQMATAAVENQRVSLLEHGLLADKAGRPGGGGGSLDVTRFGWLVHTTAQSNRPRLRVRACHTCRAFAVCMRHAATRRGATCEWLA